MKFFTILKFITLAFAIVLAFSFAVMLLWNWLIPEIFDGPRISFPQAVGLLALAKVLLGFGRGGWGGGKRYRRNTWKKKFESKWENMSPEEKEKFKHSFIGCCYDKKPKKKLETA